MMHQLRPLVSALILTLFTLATLHAAEPAAGGERAVPPATGRYITLGSLERTLPPAPIVAGFDIDDTVLFSSPGYSFGAHNSEGPGGKNRYGDDFLNNPQFWKDLNQQHDRYSLKKRAGDELLQLHKRRGDSILFITRRFCYDDDAEILAKRLQRLFNVQARVYCTNAASKTPVMSETGVDLYYGDADSDIEDAAAVQARRVRAVRVERNRLSSNVSGYHPGIYGEEVLTGSAE